jgi:hypothetical protein
LPAVPGGGKSRAGLYPHKGFFMARDFYGWFDEWVRQQEKEHPDETLEQAVERTVNNSYEGVDLHSAFKGIDPYEFEKLKGRM